ncbi:MAG: hypothetical protein JO307_03640 [Bryobacterales bacterium]|nr:hypothetical protein [Bryobacterales bacterium]MBV9398373.1 hypothetical protein [Bryobacterales bacterium]
MATRCSVLLRSRAATWCKRDTSGGKTPGSPQLNSFGPNVTLAKQLLERGEKSVVLEYFAECRSFWKMGGPSLDSWTATIQRGETPNFGANLVY